MASLPTLDEIKEALGIADDDASKDEAITSMLDATIAIVEQYLGRGILYVEDETQEFDPPDTRVPSLLLFRFPVESVSAVELNDAPLTGWQLYRKPGIVRWREPHYFHSRCSSPDPVIVITYTGGYPDDQWPADLVEAVMRAFYGRWGATGDSGNLAELEAGGANRSVSVDGLTVQRDSTSWAGTALADQVVPPDLASVAALLEPYRMRTLTGI